MPQIPSGFGQNRGILFFAEDGLGRPTKADGAWKNRDKRVVDIKKLADALASDHSAKFAEDMIEGVESVRFQQS
jgi:hypothetical protein